MLAGMRGKKISVIAAFTSGKFPKPLRIRFENDDELYTINIDYVMDIKEENKDWINYICRSVVHDRKVQFTVSYKVGAMQWFLNP